jgi:cytochrome c
MTDRFNTFFGWTLFAGIIALGLTILSGMYFKAGKHEEMETFGYAIEGGEEEGAADAGPSFLSLLATADPAAGEKVFAKCKACHTIEQGGADGIGPNLFGVIGKPVGKHAAGFGYSAALSGHGGDWTFENMDLWLLKPSAFAEGTLMSFAGLPKTEDRANLVAYMNTMGSNLPLPAAEAAAPAEDATPAEGDAAAATDGAAPAEGAAPAAAAEPAPAQ